MTEQDHASEPPPEQQKPTVDNSSPINDNKTAIQRLTELIQKNEQLQTLKEEYKKNGTIEDKNEQKKVRNIRDNVRVIIADVQAQNPSGRSLQLHPVVFDIIKNIDKSTIGEGSAPVIYELLRVSRPIAEGGCDLNTKAGVLTALQSVLDVAHFEPFTAADKILTKLLETAQAKGCTHDELEKADKFVHPENYKPTEDENKVERQKYINEYTAAVSPIDGVTLGDRELASIQAQFAATYQQALNDGTLSRELYNQMLQAKVQTETDNVQGQIRTAFNNVVSTFGSNAQEAGALTSFLSTLSGLRSAGKISPEQFESLRQMPQNESLRKYVEGQYKRREGDDLVQEAMRVFVPNRQETKLLRALSSAESLKNFLQTEKDDRGQDRYMINGKDGNINWDAFTRDIKGIFGELLSIADRNPNQFFEQAFNPMYEGHLYQVLLQRINHLGAEISTSDDEWYKSFKNKGKEIKIIEQIADINSKTKEPPFKFIVRPQEKTYDLGTAVGYFLENNMNEYKHIREHLHNLNAICAQGLGWEQLKQYSERFDLARLDRLMRQEEDLSIASNFYSTALQQEVAINGRVTMPEFGQADEVYQLNSVERGAFLQLQSYLKNKHPDIDDAVLKKQAIQKIRMAAAISTGVTGEFWNIMLTSRMPMGSDDKKDSDGNPVSSSIAATYLGTHHRGYEKMIGELDLDQVLQRFALPKFYNNLRYCLRYRDLLNPPNALKNGGFHHDLIYKAKDEVETAMKYGRSEDLVDLDEQYSYFMDYMRTKCVGLFARGGWRFSNWEACKVPKENNPTKIDYIKTLAEVRQMGSYITKAFLDELKPADAANMTREEIRALLGIDKEASQLTEVEKKLFDKKNRKNLYDRILFFQIGNVTPTKFLQMEERRWTPRGENLLRDDLYAYLQEIFKDKGYSPEFLNFHMYKMYVSALTLAEKTTWMERRKDNQNYEFGETDIDFHAKELKDFFTQYKKNYLGTIIVGNKRLSIEETEDEFIKNLKGFQKKLRDSINRERFNNVKGARNRRQETLQERFASFLAESKPGEARGNIANLIGGDDFDMQNFYFAAGGGYATTRMMGETFSITSKMNPKLQTLINEVIPDFVKGEYKDIHDVEKVIREKFVPLFKDIHGAIAGMDKAQADEFCVSLVLFVSNMVGKDRISRIKGIGPVVDWMKRKYTNTQSSLMQDFYRNDLMRPTHAMDSDEIYALGHIILNAINLPFSNKIPAGYEKVGRIQALLGIKSMVYKDEKYEDKKFLGIPYKKRIYGEEEWEHKKFLGIPYKKYVGTEEGKQEISIENYEKSAGLTPAIKTLETYLPVVGGTLILLLIAMAYLASQKNKKK